MAANRLYIFQAASWLHFFSAERCARHDQPHDTKKQHETPNLKWRDSRDLGTRQVSKFKVEYKRLLTQRNKKYVNNGLTAARATVPLG